MNEARIHLDGEGEAEVVSSSFRDEVRSFLVKGLARILKVDVIMYGLMIEGTGWQIRKKNGEDIKSGIFLDNAFINNEEDNEKTT